MAWGIASLPGSGDGVHEQVFTEIRWAADYLLACFKGSSLVIQVDLPKFLGNHTLISPLQPCKYLHVCQACMPMPEIRS